MASRRPIYRDRRLLVFAIFGAMCLWTALFLRHHTPQPGDGLTWTLYERVGPAVYDRVMVGVAWTFAALSVVAFVIRLRALRRERESVWEQADPKRPSTRRLKGRPR